MIELTYAKGRMSPINRAADQVFHHPIGLRPSSKTLRSERTPGLMMPRAKRTLLRPAITVPTAARPGGC